MAIKTLNSVAGFSVQDSPGNIVIIIDSNGNVTTPDLSVTGLSNLGNVANITITGGSNGYVLTTDGAGNLSWGVGGGGGSGDGLMPFYIPAGETYTIPQYRQGLFLLPITVDGTLTVNGALVQV